MPLLVVLDGLDGAGKSVTASALANVLIANGRSATVVKPESLYYRHLGIEPADVPQFSRRLEYGLRGAAMVSQVLNGSDSGDIVICDRFVDSIVAVYAALANSRAADRIFAHPNAFASPDVPILLKCCTSTRQRRLEQRVQEMSERKRRASFELADVIEQSLFSSRSWIVINNDSLTVNATALAILDYVLVEDVTVCKRS